jgi:putative NADPH-quinone reductase
MPKDDAAMQSWSEEDRKKVLVLNASPRLDGNSRLLASALSIGAREAGHDVVVVDLVRHVRHMLQYCKTCRGEDGECALDDEYKSLFLDLYVPADAIVFATPIWWYGVSGHMKTFLDRMACYISESSPHGKGAKPRVMGKRMALLLSAEESNFASRLGLIDQMTELCRHLRCEFVGVVAGVGNLRGEVANDPLDPVGEARKLGTRLLSIESTDYELDTPRSLRVWGSQAQSPGSYWR